MGHIFSKSPPTPKPSPPPSTIKHGHPSPNPTPNPAPTPNPTLPLNTTPTPPTSNPDPPTVSTENSFVEPSLSTDSVSPPASKSTGTTAAEAPSLQSSLVNGNGSSDGSQVSGSQLEPDSPTGSDYMFRTKGGDADPTMTPFSEPPVRPVSSLPAGSGDLQQGVPSAHGGASAPFATSIAGGAAASPHNPAAIVLGVLVPLFAILLAVAGYLGYKRHRRLRDRRAWERTHEEIAAAVRDARPSVQPWVNFLDSPGAFERGGETPAPAPERNSVYGGIEKESFDGTALYAGPDRQQ